MNEEGWNSFRNMCRMWGFIYFITPYLFPPLHIWHANMPHVHKVSLASLYMCGYDWVLSVIAKHVHIIEIELQSDMHSRALVVTSARHACILASAYTQPCGWCSGHVAHNIFVHTTQVCGYCSERWPEDIAVNERKKLFGQI